MKRVISILLLFFISPFSGTAWSQSEKNPLDTVNRALEAMGGVDAVSRIKSIRIKGENRAWEPEQSVVPDGEMRLLGDSSFVLLRDLGSDKARINWDRKLVYPNPREYIFTEIISGGVGYVQGIDTTSRTKQSLNNNPPAHAMSGFRVATALRELKRASPALLLEMRTNAKKLSAMPDQEAGGKRLSAVNYQGEDQVFTVLFDPDTRLPARIRTLDYDNIHGDSNFDLVLSDWREVGGVKLAYQQVYQLNGRDIAHIKLEEVSLNPPLAPTDFEIPAAIKASAPQPAKANVPYQWVIRRQYLGVYLDSDRISFDPEAGSGLRLVELAPGVQQVVGGTHNSLVVEMPTYLVVFDAPVNEGQSQWTIDAAKAKYPGKPIKYLVMTHHHMDHAGGARTYVAEGATIVLGKGNGEHFQKIFSAPHKVDQDALQRSPRKPEIMEVADKKLLTDGQRELGIYRIENVHATDMVIGYVADARLGFVADLWSPGRDKLEGKPTPGQASLVAAVKKAGIAPERFAGGHGTVAQYAELEQFVAKSQ